MGVPALQAQLLNAFLACWASSAFFVLWEIVRRGETYFKNHIFE